MAKVVEYFLDEAASGTTPSTALDSGPATACPLTWTYGGNSNYNEPAASHRGWQSTSDSGSQRGVYAISNTSDKVRNINGGTQYTIVVVLTLTSISASGGRIFGINDRVGSTGKLIASGTSISNLSFSFNDADAINSVSLSSGVMAVLHFVVNTTLATGADRVVCYKDGSLFGSSVVSPPALNDTLSMGSDVDLILGNRESSGSFDRSFTGTCHYAAIYDNAMSSGDVSTSYTALAASDDTPGGSSIIPIAMRGYRQRRAG